MIDKIVTSIEPAIQAIGTEHNAKVKVIITPDQEESSKSKDASTNQTTAQKDTK